MYTGFARGVPAAHKVRAQTEQVSEAPAAALEGKASKDRLAAACVANAARIAQAVASSVVHGKLRMLPICMLRLTAIA